MADPVQLDHHRPVHHLRPPRSPERACCDWLHQSRLDGASSDPLLPEEAPSGVPSDAEADLGVIPNLVGQRRGSADAWAGSGLQDADGCRHEMSPS